MSKLEMEFYTVESGVQFSVTWKNDEEYRRAKAFLTELAGPPVGRDAGKPEFYYFETDEQCRALFRFQRELRESIARS